MINETLTDEIEIFRENTNVFKEYMFTYFYFEPMNEQQIKAIMWESLSRAYGGQCAFLNHVYDNYFMQMFGFFKTHTANINELQYLFRFLYPTYVKKLYEKKQAGISNELILETKSILSLFDANFKSIMAEIQRSLYMHMSTLKDVEKDALEKKQDEQTAKIIQ